MYAEHFGLDQDPFSIAPDPHYLFMSDRHREALAHLLFGLSEKSGASGGFVLLSGEIGTGKTTVCRCFLEQIPPTCRVAYIFNPKLTVLELLQTVCEEFHVAVPSGASTAKDHIDPLNAFLLAGHSAGLNNLLIIDEAQNLSPEVLEQLRLLTNLETNEKKLLQIVLIGQPELRIMLARPDLEQLAQRIVARFHLNALNAQETHAYMTHRLGVAGWTGEIPFDAKAVKAIHRITGGVPRRINLLGGRALLGAYAQGTKRVTVQTVKAAAEEVFEAPLLGGASGLSWVARKLAWTQSIGTLKAAALGALGAVFVAGSIWWTQFPGNPPYSLPRTPSLTLSTTMAMPRVGTSSAAPMGASAAANGIALQLRPASKALPPPIDLLAAMKMAPPTAASAWRELGQLWLGHAMSEDANPCTADAVPPVNPISLGTGALACFAVGKAKLALLMQLGRPGIVTLQDASGQQAHALLLALSAERATLALAGGTYVVPVVTLQALWNGDFATLWRTPPGYVGEPLLDQPAPVLDWLTQRLHLVNGKVAPMAEANPIVAATQLRKQLRSFQRAQGLAVDGRPGPLTLMQLNRETGVTEPRWVTP